MHIELEEINNSVQKSVENQTLVAEHSVRAFELFLSRPFSILGTSLWNYWYQSELFQSLTGFKITEGVFFGTPAIGGKNKQEFLVRCFRNKEELSRMRNFFGDLLEFKPSHALELLEAGEEIFVEESGRAEAFDPKEAVFGSPLDLAEEYAKIGTFTGLLPYLFAGRCSVEDKELCERIEKLANGLRAKTLYPTYFEKVVLPYLADYADISKESANNFTFKELFAIKDLYPPEGEPVSEQVYEQIRDKIEEREAQCARFDFVYRAEGNTEKLEFVEHEEAVQRQGLVEQTDGSAENMSSGNSVKRPGTKESNESESSSESGEIILKGVVVSKGDGKPVRGIARVVTGTDISGVEFNEGDILVTIHSSPIYLPLIVKAGALLSEEGGIACHTVVLTKGQVVIMGLKDVTNSIKNGQYIELDVIKSIIKLI